MLARPIDEYLTIKKAARIAGVSAQTLRNWVARGWLPCYRNPANNYRLFLETDIKEFLKNIGDGYHGPIRSYPFDDAS